MLPLLLLALVVLDGLVASCREREGESGALSLLTLEDEYGTLDVQAPGCDPENVSPVVVAEGAVEERYGVPSLVSTPDPGNGAGSGGGVAPAPPFNCRGAATIAS
jgi:hypothetical protein